MTSNNEILSFDYFDTLHFSTAYVNLPSRNNGQFDEIDELTNNYKEYTIHQCKYYNSHGFDSISHCKRVS